MPSSSNIRFFSECSLNDVALVGGKGANLGELTSAGFPVPEGFCVTANAFRLFLDANGLEAKIRKIVAAIDFGDHVQVAAETERIRELLTAAPIPSVLIDEIRVAYARLGDEPLVAVRSSSAVPNLAVSSFPGMMDTFYDILGLEKVLQHVKLCWGSLWTARAAANRWNKGINHFSIRISALVQLMIPSEYSGIAFTVNPLTEAQELVIEAIAGLGDSLVSGKVTPEKYVVSKEALSLQAEPDRSVVPSGIVIAVASMSREIENHYGRPQDIEWAWAGGKLYVLQSRNIKKSGELPVDYAGLERWNKPPEANENEIIWTRAWSDEVLTRAITPLFYSVQADLITETYDFMYRASGVKQLLPLKLMRFHKNRGYFSTRYLKECLCYAPQFARGEDMLKFFTPEQKEEVRAMPFKAWEKIKSEIHLALHHRKYTLTRCYKTFYNNWLPELLKRVREIDQLDLDSAQDKQLSDYYWAMDRLIKDHCQPIGFGVMVHTFATVTFLSLVLEKWLKDSISAGVLLSGLPGNSTVGLNEEIWKLSRQIKFSPELHSIFVNSSASHVLAECHRSDAGREFLKELESFRQTYAFRGAEDREISFARWGDDPVLLVNVLKLMVSAGDECEPEATLKKNKARREQLTTEIEAKLSRQFWGSLKKRIFQQLLKYAQIYSLFRENQRFEIDRVFYGQRKAFLAIGRRLAQKGALADPDDIWFLSKEEVFDLMNGDMGADQCEHVVVPRRAEYRKYLGIPPPMFLQADREFDLAETGQTTAASGGTISGVPASAGKATGTARVVHDIRELGRVKPGDILVTNSTDPGWTPVFLVIKGLVLETGGILSHGTVLSREYGIPAVTSVRRATTVIREGELITIDGSSGSIYVSERSQKETEST
jgi:phosphohistidine swiveling domain-containing protein